MVPEWGVGFQRRRTEGGGATATFVHSEEFRGLLPPLLGRLLRDTNDSFVAMNEALAREVQRRRAGQESFSVAEG